MRSLLGGFIAWWAAPGRGIALALLALSTGVYIWNPPSLEKMRNFGFDNAQRMWPLHFDGNPVTIVAVNEESLTTTGQWPWPRSLVAALVQQIAKGKPASLGIDILFPEPDRFSPPLLAQTMPDLPPAVAADLARLPSTDDQLGEALAKVPTVLGEGPSDTPERAVTGAHEAPVTRQFFMRQSGGDPRPYLKPYKSMIRTVPAISRRVRAEAAITDQSDEDGIVRAVPLLTLVGADLVPTLGLEVLQISGFPSPPIDVKTGALGIDSLNLAQFEIPTDAQGRAYLHFQPPRARYIAASDVLRPDFDVSQFRDQVVLLGVTGLGLTDTKITPLGRTQGIDVHAQLIESILGQTLLHRPAFVFWIELAILLLTGAAVIGLLPYDMPRLATTGALGLAVGLIAGEFALFRLADWLIDGIYPTAALLLTAGGMLVGHLRAAQLARRRLAAELEHERELIARTEGELAAARGLQLGLLPHHFPPFPERPDIDLYARIEPARAVGGDFFDFLLIDESHLFFIIADVSGKGVPAALFMEMTLQIVRAAVQRHECDLEQVLAESNAKTAAASMDMGEAGDGMFVTAFAGIVDTGSGEVVYASAGHDSPFLIDDNELRQFKTDGGPPLGVLDEYPYPIDRGQLEPGTVLLLFTDGVTEAQDAKGELYSSRRLSDALNQISVHHARAVVDACFDAVGRFVGNAEQADDLTCLAIRLVSDPAAVPVT